MLCQGLRRGAGLRDEDAVPLAEQFGRTAELLRRAEAGDGAAQGELAGVYLSLSGCLDQYGPEEDRRAACSWARKAADRGAPEGLYQFGLCLRNGWGIRTDGEAAVRLLARGAELGHTGCQRDLGVWYLEGTGVPRDERKGFRLNMDAAVQGDSQAMFNVGMCYQLGIGVGYSLKRALDWFEVSQEAFPKPELARRVGLIRAVHDLEKEESGTDLPAGHGEALAAAREKIRNGT